MTPALRQALRASLACRSFRGHDFFEPAVVQTPAGRRNLTAVSEMISRWGEARNSLIHKVPGYGSVTVQARALDRLESLGLVTTKLHTETYYVGEGLFGRQGGQSKRVTTWVSAVPTDAGRAALGA